MSVASQSQLIDDLLGKATKAIAKEKCFEAERLAYEALDLARQDDDFERMAGIVPTLARVRLHRVDQVVRLGRIHVLDTPVEDSVTIEPACYLVQPPLVGDHARRFRLIALQHEIPVVVLCREPRIQIGLIPIVGLGTGATVRVKADPIPDAEHPDMDWYLHALDVLGEAAAELDPEMHVEKRIDLLLARLDAVPDHAGLHQYLLDTCREAAQLLSADDGGSGRKR